MEEFWDVSGHEPTPGEALAVVAARNAGQAFRAALGQRLGTPGTEDVPNSNDAVRLRLVGVLAGTPGAIDSEADFAYLTGVLANPMLPVPVRLGLADALSPWSDMPGVLEALVAAVGYFVDTSSIWIERQRILKNAVSHTQRYAYLVEVVCAGNLPRPVRNCLGDALVESGRLVATPANYAAVSQLVQSDALSIHSHWHSLASPLEQWLEDDIRKNGCNRVRQASALTALISCLTAERHKYDGDRFGLAAKLLLLFPNDEEVLRGAVRCVATPGSSYSESERYDLATKLLPYLPSDDGVRRAVRELLLAGFDDTEPDPAERLCEALVGYPEAAEIAGRSLRAVLSAGDAELWQRNCAAHRYAFWARTDAAISQTLLALIGDLRENEEFRVHIAIGLAHGGQPTEAIRAALLGLICDSRFGVPSRSGLAYRLCSSLGGYADARAALVAFARDRENDLNVRVQVAHGVCDWLQRDDLRDEATGYIRAFLQADYEADDSEIAIHCAVVCGLYLRGDIDRIDPILIGFIKSAAEPRWVRMFAAALLVSAAPFVSAPLDPEDPGYKREVALAHIHTEVIDFVSTLTDPDLLTDLIGAARQWRDLPTEIRIPCSIGIARLAVASRAPARRRIRKWVVGLRRGLGFSLALGVGVVMRLASARAPAQWRMPGWVRGLLRGTFQPLLRLPPRWLLLGWVSDKSDDFWVRGMISAASASWLGQPEAHYDLLALIRDNGIDPKLRAIPVLLLAIKAATYPAAAEVLSGLPVRRILEAAVPDKTDTHEYRSLWQDLSQAARFVPIGRRLLDGLVRVAADPDPDGSAFPELSSRIWSSNHTWDVKKQLDKQFVAPLEDEANRLFANLATGLAPIDQLIDFFFRLDDQRVESLRWDVRNRLLKHPKWERFIARVFAVLPEGTAGANPLGYRDYSWLWDW